jgi:tripartite-type tricarboxylate transporter receptor subunit TctC
MQPALCCRTKFEEILLMPIETSRRALIAGAAGATLARPALAQQAAWPTRPVRMVVPFAAGGGTDVSTRLLTPKMSEVLGQPVVVENRPGAGGTTGTDFVAKAPADGSVFLMATLSTVGLALGLYSSLPYDPVKDLAPVAPTVLVPVGLVARPDLGARTLREFIALLKANPGKYQYGSAGNGTSGHIACANFLTQSGTEAVHVPYRGSGPVFNDLLAGVVHFTADLPGLIKPHHDAGTLRALVMATDRRSALLPDVPTSAEAGLPDYKAYSWYGVFAPARTPQPIVARMAQAVEAALSDPEIARRLEGEMGLPPMRGYTPERFGAFLRDEIALWVPIVRATGARAD